MDFGWPNAEIGQKMGNCYFEHCINPICTRGNDGNIIVQSKAPRALNIPL